MSDYCDMMESFYASARSERRAAVVKKFAGVLIAFVVVLCLVKEF